ncbi:carboxylating nicotinate-nucleotide diphosphorylase [Flavihumibacter petaseus]|uniref:Probable nicotinate-nucleotide pyrophosphorylase [carboxylating] n=1 Tax=Flavihumibacter petaseus NBRC 106054 TaxID=1220578 RepID=A0A0E9N574_9BACT|nr:carboxylating nicotinate-nucleotide diphosphorylase [Flavihumibacter petaseus]GAO45112.1 quinolinate phosphoribosyltransferase [Flavihumibacter petaseus NBRC 106054]
MMDFDQQLNQLIANGLAEDIGDGDHSTLSVIPPGEKGTAVLKIKEAGILAGVEAAGRIFRYLEPACKFERHKQDGEAMVPGETAFIVSADVHTILQAERLVLNCMQRMSGIATLTHQYAQVLNGHHTRILDTRKTTPNFRLLEKWAVAIGGGVNHRFALYDMIMLKDNHIDYCGGITKAVEKAWHYVQTKKPGMKIEVETRTLEDVKELVAIGKGKVFRIMLDNFTIPQIETALPLIGRDFETEASGGINLQNLLDYANTGVDYVSVGALIHQARSLDLSLKAVKA